jgi:DNA-binding PadR family transcriptional regulator
MLRRCRKVSGWLDKEHISAYCCDVRRRQGELVVFELAICAAAADLYRSGTSEFYGYQIAKHLSDVRGHRLLTAYGTLYRALGRLEQMGCLRSRWEDPHIPAQENRPGRRLYTLTAAGEAEALKAPQKMKASTKRTRRKLAPA